MLKKIIVSFFLLPAAFYLYKRKTIYYLVTNPHYLFNYIIRENKAINKQNFLHNFLIYYPMKLGIKIYFQINYKYLKNYVKSMSDYFLMKLGQNKEKTLPNTSDNLAIASPLPPPSIEFLIQLIKNEKIKVISFDIFDTLLIRPIIQDPRDIFYLVAEKIKNKYNINFIDIRWDAEKELNDPYATIDDIYNYIENKFHTKPDIIEKIKQEELHCEFTLLKPSKNFLYICNIANKLGKRIIATSDMYIPSKILLDLLHKKGFKYIKNVYVSSEEKARKTDEGALFDIVLNREHVNKNEILHIGDNYIADVIMPIKKGIAAIHYPSIKQQCQEHGGDLYKLLTDIAKKNPLYSLILGQSLENIFNNYKKSPTNLEQCTSILDFGNLVIAPLATLLTLKIISIAKQNGYNNIYYASRDGWLLYQIHKSIEIFIDAPKAIYFQAGRRAYYPFIEPSFLEYVKKQPVKNKEFITVSDIIKIYFNKEAKSLISKLTYEEQKTKFFFNFSYTEKIFKKIENEIIAFMNYKRECALKYYNSIFSSNEGKVLIFDIGYSGSISIALSKILKKPVDKVYCWQTNENIKRDSQNNTKTFVLMEQPDEYSPFNLVLEELFSPCIGGTIDFDNEGNPIHEKLEISNEMLNTLELLHKQCVKYAISTINNFSDYSIFLSNARQDPALKLYKQLFQIKPFNNRTIFNSIVFPDPIYLSESLSLEQKIDNFSSHETSLTATGFEEYKNILHPQTLCYITNNFRTAIHVHIFNPLLAQEISSYLYNIHTDFDLFITYVNNNDIDFFKKIFNSTVIKHIKNVHFIQTPNRGRDIAPWIIATAEVQKNYDLFCHIHAKESKYFKNGKEWRRYLLDNLLRPEALNTIFAAFSQNSKLGMLFPAIFPEIRNTIITNNLSLGTSTTKEYELIIKLLKRMKLSPTYSRSEQFYSCGTMFWYRPQALNLLFDCGIKYEDFPPEPIETGGTLAHALERIPPILCKRSGYDVRSLTIYKNKVTT